MFCRAAKLAPLHQIPWLISPGHQPAPTSRTSTIRSLGTSNVQDRTPIRPPAQAPTRSSAKSQVHERALIHSQAQAPRNESAKSQAQERALIHPQVQERSPIHRQVRERALVLPQVQKRAPVISLVQERELTRPHVQERTVTSSPVKSQTAPQTLVDKRTAILAAMSRLSSSDGLIARAELTRHAPELIYQRAPSSYGGKTKSQSLSRDLQELRKRGLIEFVDYNGLYRISDEVKRQYYNQ